DLLLGGDDHVEDPDGGARAGRLAEAEGLQRVEGADRAVLSGDLVAAPDDVGELLLRDGRIEETELFRPDLVEADAAGGGDEDLALAVAVDPPGRPVVGVAHPD